MFSADQGNDLAKAFSMCLDQGPAMAVFFAGHAFEDLGGFRIIGAQSFCVAAIDAGVVFFGRDGQCQDLLFGQISKPATISHVKHGELL